MSSSSHIIACQNMESGSHSPKFNSDETEVQRSVQPSRERGKNLKKENLVKRIFRNTYYDLMISLKSWQTNF